MFHAPRGRATRRAAPRRAGPPAIRFFILILFSLSLSLSFRLSLTSLPLAFLPLFRRRFSLSSFLSFLYSLVLFSLHSYRPTTLQSACANWASREGETITRGGKKKKKYQFQGFSSRSTRFGDKLSKFFFLFLFVLFIMFRVENPPIYLRMDFIFLDFTIFATVRSIINFCESCSVLSHRDIAKASAN